MAVFQDDQLSQALSLSLVMRMTSVALAASKISGSSASLNPRSRKANAVMPNVMVIQVAIAGDRCASTQIIMQPKRDD